MPNMAGIYYQPPPPFMGGKQPYQGRKIAAALIPPPPAPDNPPFSYVGRDMAMPSIILASQPPLPSPFIGGRQPLQARKLHPDILNFVGDNPPLRTAAITTSILLSTWILPRVEPQQHRPSVVAFLPPDDPPANGGGALWVSYDDGLTWVYGRHVKLPPSLLTVPDNPPFSHVGRDVFMPGIIQASQPPPPNAFMGGRQPLQNRKLHPDILNLIPDNPPFSYVGRDPFMPEIILASQPPPPSPFMGGRQPLQGRVLNPSLLSLVPDNPPFRHRGRDWYCYAASVTWLAPPPPMQRRAMRIQTITGGRPPDYKPVWGGGMDWATGGMRG